MRTEIDGYFDILCPEGVPEFLLDYAQAPEMQRLKGIGLFCGTDYSRLYRHRYFFSRYDHSLAVALIVWHFTKDRRQALAGLFHDIATPVFSHSVDFMNGDALTQTSTEARTSAILAGSAAVTEKLVRDGVALTEVDDYHRYPIADNDSPRLSADRLEYTFSTMLVWHGAWTLGDIRAMYGGLRALRNEGGEDELGFDTLGRAERFVEGSCMVGKAFQRNENKVSLAMLGEIVRTALALGETTYDALFEMTERAFIRMAERSKHARLRHMWAAYAALDTVRGGESAPPGRYAVRVKAKQRYINPLALLGEAPRRAMDASPKARAAIEGLLAYRDAPYGYVDISI